MAESAQVMEREAARFVRRSCSVMRSPGAAAERSGKRGRRFLDAAAKRVRCGKFFLRASGGELLVVLGDWGGGRGVVTKHDGFDAVEEVVSYWGLKGRWGGVEEAREYLLAPQVGAFVVVVLP